MILCYHIEDARYVGVWPSHMEALSRLAAGAEADEVWVVDQTPDGVFDLPAHVEHARFRTLDAALQLTSRPVVAVETPERELGPVPVSLWDFHHPRDALYVFGPHNGIQFGRFTHHVYVPMDLDVRDAIAAVMADRCRKG